MWGGFNPQARAQGEYLSDLWIQQNVPGGLYSPLGQRYDNYLGGNPNPIFGQAYGGHPHYHHFSGPAHHYRAW